MQHIYVTHVLFNEEVKLTPEVHTQSHCKSVWRRVVTSSSTLKWAHFTVQMSEYNTET